MFNFGFVIPILCLPLLTKCLAEQSFMSHLPSVLRAGHPAAGLQLLRYNAEFTSLNYCRALMYPRIYELTEEHQS